MKGSKIIENRPSKDLFCEIIRELYVESEWYLS